MRKRDEIAKLIRGSRKEASQFITQVNDTLPERATLSNIVHVLTELPFRKRTPQEVVVILTGKRSVVEREINKLLAYQEKESAKSKKKAISHKVNLKTDWREFEQILQAHEISSLYHFTDSKNLPSIVEHNGLYSWDYCKMNDIEIPCPGGNDVSRNLDIRRGLQDYVHLGFNRKPRMLDRAKLNGCIVNEVILEVDPSVIHWESTKFSDMNATDNLATIGDDLESFKKIEFDVATASGWIGEMEQKWRQAEVLVKTHIPLSFIKDFQ